MQGKARILPDAVNTDYIISSSRKRQIKDIDVLKNYIFEDLHGLSEDPIQPGDVLVAGEDFGCGSAMEIAVDVLKASEIKCILAKSFARTFHRNAANAGLPLLTWESGSVDEGDQLTIEYGPKPTVKNETKNIVLGTKAVPDFIVRLVRAGGLINYCNEHGMPPTGLLR